MRYKLLLVSLLILTPLSKSWAEPLRQPVAVVNNYNHADMWQGAYLGTYVGYISTADTANNDNTSPGDNNFSIKVSNTSGPLFSFFGGTNFSFPNNIVMSIESSVSKGLATGVQQEIVFERPQIIEGNTVTSDSSHRLNVTSYWVGDARLRLAYAMNDFLPFVSVGAAFYNYENVTVSADHNKDKDYISVYHRSSPGVTIGVGCDYAIAKHVLLRAEYRYMRFKDLEYQISQDKIAYLPLQPHVINLGIAYRF